MGEPRTGRRITAFVVVAGAFTLTACGGGGGGGGVGSPDTSSGDYAAPTFAASVRTFQGLSSELLVGDFNGDNRPDLLVAQPTTSFPGIPAVPAPVTMSLGNGDGTFRDLGSVPSVVAFSPPADVDGDGKLDMPYCTGSPGQIGVIFGNGDGTFGSPIQYSFGPASGGDAALCHSVAIGDFNGDGIPDIVVVSYLDDEIQTRIWISVLHGNGDRTFRSAVRQPVPAFSGFAGLWVSPGDFDTDGKSDLLVFTSTSQVAGQATHLNYVLLSNGDGTFRSASDGGLPSPASLSDIDYFHAAIGDFNGDGRLDLVLGSYLIDTAGSHLTLGLYLGNGDGTFRPPTFTYDVASPYFGTYGIGDLDHDRRSDLVVFETPSGVAGTTSANQRFRFFRGNADGTMSAPIDYALQGGRADLFQIIDANGDGWPDILLRSEGYLEILLNARGAKSGP